MPVATHTTNVYVDPNLTQTENFLNLLRHHNYVNTDYFGDIEEISPFSRSKTVAGATFNTEVWVHITPNSPLHFKQKSSYSKTWYNRVPLSNTFVDYDPNNKETWPVFRYEEGTYGDFTGEPENDNVILYKIANNLTCFSQDTRFPFSATTEENNTVLVITASGASPCYHGSVKIRLELPYAGPGIYNEDLPTNIGSLPIRYIHQNALPGKLRDRLSFKDNKPVYIEAIAGVGSSAVKYLLVPVNPNLNPVNVSPTMFLGDNWVSHGTPDQIRGDVELPNGVTARNGTIDLPHNPAKADHPRKVRAFEAGSLEHEGSEFYRNKMNNYPFEKPISGDADYDISEAIYTAFKEVYGYFVYNKVNGYNELTLGKDNIVGGESLPDYGLFFSKAPYTFNTYYFPNGTGLRLSTTERILTVQLMSILRNYFLHTNATARNAQVIKSEVTPLYSDTVFRGDVTLYNDTLRNIVPGVYGTARERHDFETVNETSSITTARLHERNDDEVIEVEVSVKNPLNLLRDDAVYKDSTTKTFAESVSGYVGGRIIIPPPEGIGIRFPYVEFRLPDYARDRTGDGIWHSEQAMISFFTHEFREYLYTLFFDARPVNRRTPTRNSVEGFNEDYKSLKVQFMPLQMSDSLRKLEKEISSAEWLFGKDDNVRMWRITYPDVANHPFVKGSLLVRCFKNT